MNETDPIAARIAELDRECEADAHISELPPAFLHRKLLRLVRDTLSPSDLRLLGGHLHDIDPSASRWLRVTLAACWADSKGYGV
jgi:hypothetical protein